MDTVDPQVPRRWSWSRAAAHVQRDLLLFAISLAALAAVRIVFIGIFHRHLGPGAGTLPLLSVMFNGMRFDGRIAIFVVAPTLLVSLCALRWAVGSWLAILRLALGWTFLSLTVLLAAIDVGFFAEYDDQFNHFVLGAFYDDFAAIVKTVWAEHHVVLFLCAWLAAIAAIGWILRRLLALTLIPPTRFAAWPAWRKVVASVAVLLLIVIAARGSIWKRPIQAKDIAVTSDDFLNKVVLNPYKALQYAIEDYRNLQQVAGITAYLPDGDVRAAARRFFADERDLDDLDAYCRREARGAAHPPKHIYLVVMESYSAWPLLPRYRSLGLAESLGAASTRGLSLMRFISAGSGTMSSLGTIISGVPDAGVLTNYQASGRLPFPTSLPAIFKRLGYRTRFFYAGFPSWQRIGPFARDQGFDEVHAGADLGANWMSGKEWGVDDERLLEVAAQVSADPAPSLNVIMTVSNHPPFGLDVEHLGFPLTRVPDDLAGSWDDSTTLHVLGHFWYADRCLGRFISAVEAQDPDLLVAVTGDHYGRRFINAQPTLYERTAVPFVLYGPQALAGRTMPESAAGSHLDMLPTLVELSAPAGFAYHAFGRDLLTAQPRPAGFGRGLVMTADAEIDGFDPAQRETEGAMTDDDAAALAKRYRDLCGLAWWRIMRGSALPPAHAPSPSPAP